MKEDDDLEKDWSWASDSRKLGFSGKRFRLKPGIRPVGLQVSRPKLLTGLDGPLFLF